MININILPVITKYVICHLILIPKLLYFTVSCGRLAKFKDDFLFRFIFAKLVARLNNEISTITFDGAVINNVRKKNKNIN